ncbi:MAG: aldo/keto reductase [Hyphomicrobiales bacterium]|nr:aldo/keto reductase [Hyphomicrobiales bacterium]
MHGPHFIEANGAKIPAVGFGTWQLRAGACVRAVDAALGAGYRHIDTARMYGNEREVGEAIRASSVSREEVFVTTKVWREDIGAGALERSAEASVRDIGIGPVDLLLIHWPNAAIPLRASIGALCNARRQGLARHIGVSNFPVALLEEALGLATEPLVANQCEYHPRLDQNAVIAACRRHGLAFVSYSPLGKGDIVNAAAVRAIADRLGRAPAQVVLRWHIQQPGVAAIPRSGSPAHIAENFGLFDFSLSADDMAAISALARKDGRLVDMGWARFDS